MTKKDYLQVKYEEINKLKNLLNQYQEKYIDEIMVCLEKAFEDVASYLECETKNIMQKNEKTKEKQFSLKELEEFNGKDGKPAYIAIDGIVYDLSSIKKWKNGMHHGMIAGQELGEEFKKSHKKNLDIIKKAPIVGKLKVTERESDKIFTLQELKNYDGKDNNKAYVAVDGVVYDVSKILQWKDGNHFGFKSGEDLSDYFKGCHSNNIDILKNAVKVGVLENRLNEVEKMREFTIDEVSEFDGENGRLVYVVIGGTVYDLTSIKQWVDGKHYGVMAGNDLTEFFYTCHKGEEEILERLRVVGILKNQ